MRYVHIYLMPIILLALFFSCTNAYAQFQSKHQVRTREAVSIDCDTALTSDLRKVRRPYKFSDNLFGGMSFGGNRATSTAANRQSFFSMVRPSAEAFVGKYFTPWISASLNLGYDMQQEVLPALVDTSYTFHTLALSLEGQLCLNRFFSRYNPNEKFLAYAFGGIGIQSSIAFNSFEKRHQGIINTDRRFAPLYCAGAMLEWRPSEGTSLIARGQWASSSTDICGLGDGHLHQAIDLSVGFLFRLPNHYASRAFQDCRGNEIYYFSMLEDRLLSDHQKQLKRHHKGKTEAPIMAAEQDTILIFPCGYPFLTERQEAKLDLVASRLSSDPNLILVVDLYPIVSDDPKMTPAQSVQRSEVAIRTHLLKHKLNPVNASQFRFQQHPDQESPVANQSIWIHGAFLHYESSTPQR